MEPFQCRGVKGKVKLDVGVVIVPSKSYQDCSVDINCPHYIKHPLTSESQAYNENAGNCRVSKGRRCLYDRLDGSKL